MNVKKLREDYKKYAQYYKDFQKEVAVFLKEKKNAHESFIDIHHISPRPSGIKKISKIERNLNDPTKYKNYKTLFELRDIAGVRVTCHCEDDKNKFADILQRELKQKYSNVIRKPEEDNENSYRAIHITFSKEIINSKKIFCEIQIRTVTADAWAVQSHKYVYGKNAEGDTHDLTDAMSEIMNGCEKIWSALKKKSRSTNKSGKINKKAGDIDESSNKQRSNLDQQNNDLIEWFEGNNTKAKNGFLKAQKNASMEVKFVLPNSNLNASLKELNDSAKESTVHTFGWPIGLFLDRRDEYAPKIGSDSISAEVFIEKQNWPNKNSKNQNLENKTYDYWSLHKSGAFYLLKSIFEDERRPTHLFFNTRIVRITEVLMYARNLYNNLGVDKHEDIEVCIKHDGLKGRILGSSSLDRELFTQYQASINTVQTLITTNINEIEVNMVDIVEKITQPLFEKFDLFELNREVLEEISLNYTQGKMV